MNPCKHPVLHFENGGQYVVCSNPECGRAWHAMNESRLVLDFMAMTEGLTEQDIRRDPFAL